MIVLMDGDEESKSLEVQESKEGLNNRIMRLLKKPDFLDLICSHVANGSTLISFCQTLEVPYGRIANWIHSDPERERRYLASLEDRGEWAVERVIQELMRIATSDIRDIFNEKGGIKDPKDWPDGIAQAVAAIEVMEEFDGVGQDREHIGYTKRVKFWDKPKALELLGKNLKMFIERHEHSGNVTLAELVMSSMKPEGDNK
jgi:hypothetical protein